MKKIIICEICREDISCVDPEKLTLPLTSDQFPPPHEGHAGSLLWPGQAFEDILCPFGPHEPFLNKDKVYIKDEGLYTVGTALLPPEGTIDRAMAEFVSDAEAESDDTKPKKKRKPRKPRKKS